MCIFDEQLESKSVVIMQSTNHNFFTLTPPRNWYYYYTKIGHEFMSGNSILSVLLFEL